MSRKPFNLELESHKLSRNQRLKYSLEFAIQKAGKLRRTNIYNSDQTMAKANQDSNRASSSGLGESSGISVSDNGSRKGSMFITLTPKLKKILGISSVSPSPTHGIEREPRSQSALSGCFSSKASDTTSSSGSTASLPAVNSKAAEKLRKKREKEAKKLEKERKKREKAEQKRLKAEQKRTPSPADQLPSDSAIRDYFFLNKKVLNDKRPVARSYNAAQVRAAAASFEAAAANGAIPEPVAGPSFRSQAARLLDDDERIYMGSPKTSRPSSRANCYIRYREEDEDCLGNMISTKFTQSKKE